MHMTAATIANRVTGTRHDAAGLERMVKQLRFVQTMT